MLAKRGVQLEVNAAKQLIKNSKSVDQEYRNDAPGPSVPREFPGFLVFRVTSQISGMSGAKPGTGMGIPQSLAFPNGTTYADYGTTQYTLYNNNEKNIKAGAYVTCIQMYGRPIVYIVDKCSNLV